VGAPRHPHPGNVAWAERVRPDSRKPPRVILFDPVTGDRAENVPLDSEGFTKNAAYILAKANEHKPWARRWLRVRRYL